MRLKITEWTEHTRSLVLTHVLTLFFFFFFSLPPPPLLAPHFRCTGTMSACHPVHQALDLTLTWFNCKMALARLFPTWPITSFTIPTCLKYQARHQKCPAHAHPTEVLTCPLSHHSLSTLLRSRFAVSFSPSLSHSPFRSSTAAPAAKTTTTATILSFLVILGSAVLNSLGIKESNWKVK